MESGKGSTTEEGFSLLERSRVEITILAGI